MKGVIIAAGEGSRLWLNSNKNPKTLLLLGSKTLLFHIINNMYKAGIDDFIIVVGYRKELIKRYLRENNYFGLNITLVENREYQRGNGLSVLAAENEVDGEPFILSMSDHIVSSETIKRLVESEGQGNLLLVDPKIDQIFDIDDATKVKVEGRKLISIGKLLSLYNGIDCGIFRLNSKYFESMRDCLKENKESISDAVEGLIQMNDMEVVFIEDGEFWLDIDTPEAYQYAMKKYHYIKPMGDI